MDGSLVLISVIDTTMTVIFGSQSKIFGILRVFRLVRALRRLRVINRAPGLKLVVQTLLSSLKPIGYIVLICCTFFIIFGILGVQVRSIKLKSRGYIGWVIYYYCGFVSLQSTLYFDNIFFSCSKEYSITAKDQTKKTWKIKPSVWNWVGTEIDG